MAPNMRSGGRALNKVPGLSRHVKFARCSAAPLNFGVRHYHGNSRSSAVTIKQKIQPAHGIRFSLIDGAKELGRAYLMCFGTTFMPLHLDCLRTCMSTSQSEEVALALNS